MQYGLLNQGYNIVVQFVNFPALLYCLSMLFGWCMESDACEGKFYIFIILVIQDKILRI